MRSYPPCFRGLALLFWACLLLAGCAYHEAIRQLSAAERVEFFTYQKVMSQAQIRTYLAYSSAPERTAYLVELGLMQRFQSLEPLDQYAIRQGAPRVGMSSEALRFLWGDPYDTAGDAARYAHWYYLGSSFTLAESGNDYHTPGNRVDVYIVDGKVVGWVDYIPSTNEPSRKRRRIL
ncbi:MAG: hypothetical protein AB7N91_11625 [Candidatus Tectimicrobiota bacterium]